MNLSRALDVGLPELPAQRYRETYFRFDPRTIARLHQEPDRTIMRCLAPNSRTVMNITPNQWALVQMFDGRRSYQQLADLWFKKCGVKSTPEFIQSFAENLDSINFWYKTPQEESVALMEELRRKRQERQQKQVNDFSRIYLWVFDPDRVLTAIYRVFWWVFSPWFVALTLCAIGWMLFTWFSRSADVWRDSLGYWNMTTKTGRDVLEFYLTFLVVGFFHESGHAMTVKHFGGQVRRMGMLLVYTTPAFFVDMAQIWLYRSRRERCLNILAGFWVELTVCAFATWIWSGTPAGTPAHEFAYKFVLVGGIMPVLFNMNPLARLDGYMFFCEFFRIPSLREKATAFLTAWIRHNIFRMPISVPPLTRKRAIFYALFAIFTGVYTVLFLTFLARLTYRVAYRFSPEWAFIPATLVALRIFKSRIITFMAFLKALYLDKKDLVLEHRGRVLAGAAAALVVLFLPLFHESVSAPFVLEPAQRAVLRAEMPVTVGQVLAREGQTVQAGDVLARLRSLDVERRAADAASQLQLADAHAYRAQLQYVGMGQAQAEQQRWAEHARVAQEQQKLLEARSPIRGIVVTPRMEDLQETVLAAGSTIAEVQDLSTMRARIYVAEPEMRTLGRVSSDSLHISGRLLPLHGQAASVSADPQAEPSLMATEKYKGIKPPPSYVLLVTVPNDGTLRAGMTGDAKIFGRRRTLAGLITQPVWDFLSRKFW
jgi:putative peptide zinc metalloprotease protein